ncbi:MAG: nucleotide sugar dehydrogenase [Chloroflexi bacterium]|nr:nucleotide sugar dehydrogenase [Chloroflexota bacterium]
MKISIFGLGYVGCVSAACLSSDGHDVIGVDLNPSKVATLNEGRSPIVEPGLDEMVAETVRVGRLRATENAVEAVGDSDLSIICVGTPSTEVGALDLQHIRRVCEQIGAALRQKRAGHTVVVRSTVLPSTTETVIIPTLQSSSGRTAGEDLSVVVNPEFLREGAAVRDFKFPARTVIGEMIDRGGDPVARLYQHLDAPIVRTSLRAAEMVKYLDNTFHALKIAFANEIGNLCQAEGVDSHEVMNIFCLDTKLNLSAAYLKPGYAFGGSCLPKDVRALLYRLKKRDLSAPVLEAILPSNEMQMSRGIQLIRRLGKNRIGVLGLSFKAGTDDLRESPTVSMIETLMGKGYKVWVYDPNVSLANLVGTNKAFIERQLPHIANLLRDSVEQVLERVQVVVVANREPTFADIPQRLRPGQVLVDLVRLVDDPRSMNGAYYGIAW